ncbi:hypothetical protein HK104_008624 [Borealophlyctis nickersoniae]|nr:hypothetical protein HK104_008624 [Borealophlyctis nickersoniae]
MEDILLLVGAYYTDATSASRLKQTCRFYNTAITYTRLRRVLARTLLTHNCPLRSLAHRFHTTLRADYHFAAVCREILNTTTVEKSALDAVLIKAAECGYQQVTELLLSLGRDVDLCCTLKTAALRGQLEVVRVYLAFLRTAKQEDWYFGLGFLAAIVGGHEPVVRLVLDVCGKSVLNDYALLTPTRRGAWMIRSPLLPLLVAASGGHTLIAALLLDHGADPDVQNGAPLMWAEKKCHQEVVKLLLDRGAKVESYDRGIWPAAISNAPSWLLSPLGHQTD